MEGLIFKYPRSKGARNRMHLKVMILQEEEANDKEKSKLLKEAGAAF